MNLFPAHENIEEQMDGFLLAGLAEGSLGKNISGKYPADLVLTGHVHGGQFIIPGKGGLVSPDFEFFPEMYEGEHRYGDMTMIISRGLGNSVIPVRINNYPEIVRVVLRKE